MMQDLEIQTTLVQQRKLRVLLYLFLAAFAVLALRLSQLHLSPGNMLTEEEMLHIGEIRLQDSRGEIFDRNGVVLATNRKVPSVWVDPRRVRDGEEGELADLLGARLGMPREEALRRLAKTDENGNQRKFNMVKRWLADIPEEALEELRVLSRGALNVLWEPIRYYPHHDSAAHLLGFVNRAGEASEGVEAAFDRHLASREGVFRVKVDNERRPLSSSTLHYEEPEGGELLQLTLDVNIQHNLEQALDQRMEETQSVAAMGVVMDPHTGAVFAMATRPAFNPNEYDKFPPERRKNRAIIDVFEPGSAFKIVPAAAALEHGLVNVNTMINCEGGVFNPYGHSIRDFHKLGVEPFSRCFEESSNIALIKVAALLGEARMEEWIRKFGFGARTSPDFPMESRGLFRSRDKWSRLSMGSLPMGQEISVTMLQMARSFAVIANGGHLVEPYFVERAVARDGRVTYQHSQGDKPRIISPKTADTMQQLCHQVVLHGTGRAANMMEYRAGGKTGTAQMARTDGGRGYDKDRYTTVFAGFAPLANPRVVAVIVVQEPRIRLRYGGYVCGPVFKKVVGEALAAMNVPEDPVTDPEIVARHEKEKKQAEAVRLAAERKNAPKKAGKAEPPKQPEKHPDADPDTVTEISLDESLTAMITSLDGLDLVARRTGDRMETSLPDLTGLTKRQARERLQRIGIPLDAQGAGWVIAQNPPPGTALMDVTVCALQFGRPGQEPAAEAAPGDEPKTTM